MMPVAYPVKKKEQIGMQPTGRGRTEREGEGERAERF